LSCGACDKSIIANPRNAYIRRSLYFLSCQAHNCFCARLHWNDNNSLLLSIFGSDSSLYASRAYMSFAGFVLQWLENCGVRNTGFLLMLQHKKKRAPFVRYYFSPTTQISTTTSPMFFQNKVVRKTCLLCFLVQKSTRDASKFNHTATACMNVESSVGSNCEVWKLYHDHRRECYVTSSKSRNFPSICVPGNSVVMDSGLGWESNGNKHVWPNGQSGNEDVDNRTPSLDVLH
jgi:hypothetical protein